MKTSLGTGIRVVNNTEIHGIIDEVNNHRGALEFYLETKDTLFWIEISRNYQYHPVNLASFAQEGDSLSKIAGNDTIYLNRNNHIYFFEIGNLD